MVPTSTYILIFASPILTAIACILFWVFSKSWLKEPSEPSEIE